MREFINGHKLEYHGTISSWVIYIDSIKASCDRRRPTKGTEFWREFLFKNPDFDPICLLPQEKPWSIGDDDTFEALYPEWV